MPCNNKEYLADSQGSWIRCDQFPIQKAVSVTDGFTSYLCNNSNGGWGSIIECCKDLGKCNHDPALGGQKFIRGQSTNKSGIMYFCSYFDTPTPTGAVETEFVTDLDVILSKGDTKGISCEDSKYPNGTDTGYNFTHTLCCGDDGLADTYSDPFEDGSACYKGQIILNTASRLENRTTVPYIINNDGVIYGCKYSASGRRIGPTSTPNEIIGVNFCNITAGQFCS